MTAVRSSCEVDAVRPVSSEFPVALLSPAEVRELWAFVHGDIMVGGIRQELRASLGLCPRHTWGCAVVEVELWIHGAGARGGHQPFDVCVLYADLLDHAIGRLRARGHVFHHSLATTLQRHGPCRICDALGPDAEKRAPRVGYAGSNSFALAAEANDLRYTTAWFEQTQDLWRVRVCPACARRAARTSLAGDAPLGEPGTAFPYLEHMSGPRAETEVSVPALSAYVAALGERVDALGSSMRQGARPPSPEQKASWIEALGWVRRLGPPVVRHQVTVVAVIDRWAAARYLSMRPSVAPGACQIAGPRPRGRPGSLGSTGPSPRLCSTWCVSDRYAAPTDGSCSLRRGRSTVSSSVMRTVQGHDLVDRLWWLPPGGVGNGLDHGAWAPILEVPTEAVPALLEALRAVGAPGYAVRIGPRAAARSRRTGVRTRSRIYVGTSAYADAENALMMALAGAR